MKIILGPLRATSANRLWFSVPRANWKHGTKLRQTFEIQRGDAWVMWGAIEAIGEDSDATHTEWFGWRLPAEFSGDVRCVLEIDGDGFPVAEAVFEVH